MQKVSLGVKVSPLGINKVTVADGCKCRAILIDRDPRMKHISYDEKIRRRVEVDQDLLIKYNLRSTPTFYYLVAKLNTDMKGNVVSDDFVIEYLQLTENLNNEFSDAVAENMNFSSLVLNKVAKKGDGGKDFSYIKVTPSNYQVSETLAEKIAEVQSNAQAIDAMWELIDRTTSITAAEYDRMRTSGEYDTKAAQIAAPQTATAPALPPAPTQYEAPAPRYQEPQSSYPGYQSYQSAPAPVASDDFAEANDFGGDDFNF